MRQVSARHSSKIKVSTSRSLVLALIALYALCASSVNAAATTVEMTWTGKPLDITIPVGVERVLKFSGMRMQVAFPTELWGIATAESARGVVYLRTTRAFKGVRVRARNKDNGKIYSFNVTAVSGSTDMAPIVIIDEIANEIVEPAMAPPTESPIAARSPVSPQLTNEQLQMQEAPTATTEPEYIKHGVTSLVRYAMQHVYSPERLVDELSDVNRVSFDRNEIKLRIVPGAVVKTRVLGQWENGDRYVTAIYLQNMTTDQIDLDPRVLTGRHYWQVSALMHGFLTPANTFGDSTTLVAISDKKWLEYSKWLQ